VQAAIKAAIVKAAIAIWLRTIDVGAQRQGVVWVWVVVWVGRGILTRPSWHGGAGPCRGPSLVFMRNCQFAPSPG